MINFILFVFGTLFGSFLNVLSLRYKEDGRVFDLPKISGRSHCMNCGHQISWIDLIPILSFLFLLGKCRYCKNKISFQYPIVEIVSGLIFVFVPRLISMVYEFRFLSGPMPVVFYGLCLIYTLFLITLVFISLVDLRLQIIPDSSNILILVLGLVLVFIKYKYSFFNFYQYSFLGHYASLFGFRDSLLVSSLLGIFFGIVLFGGIYFLSRGRGMGFGDVKLSIALGVFLGWPDIIIALLGSFIIGSIWSIILMVGKRAGMKTLLPFGPFIVLSTVIVMFFGVNILNFYFSLFPN
ncbi:MAG: prepilin peptidase [Candidatus Pacebacteria bacterium]|nr:prepilin peptidase [Candidatus Paceibacterota bacterium]